MPYGFEDRTDNTYLPNTPEEWQNFRWHLTSFNARAAAMWSYYINKEKEHRINMKRQVEEAKDVR